MLLGGNAWVEMGRRSCVHQMSLSLSAQMRHNDVIEVHFRYRGQGRMTARVVEDGMGWDLLLLG